MAESLADNKIRKRNYTLDLFKTLGAFMVVFIHIGFPGVTGEVVRSLARFAVPLFFFASGFFAYQNSLASIRRKLVKTLILALLATALYLAYAVVYNLVAFGLDGLLSYFSNLFSPANLLYFVFFNAERVGGHLWFLWALIYVYGIAYLAVRFSINEKIVCALAVIALVTNLVLGEVLGLFGVSIYLVYTRNFILTAFPFFYIGYFANKFQDRFASINAVWAILAIIVGVAETVLSRLLFADNEIYLGTVLILFGMVVLSLKHSDHTPHPFVISIFETTTCIYIIHNLVSATLLLFLAEFVYSSPVFSYLYPPLICIISLVIGLVYNFIKKKARK